MIRGLACGLLAAEEGAGSLALIVGQGPEGRTYANQPPKGLVCGARLPRAEERPRPRSARQGRADVRAQGRGQSLAVAIFHMQVQTISRSDGRSATASAAYRSGGSIEDERTGEVHDYTRKRGVEVSELVLPAGAPTWANDRGALWNAAERAENRKNSTVAREIVVALPAELNPKQRAELARTLAAGLVERHGCAVDLAIHAPGAKGDTRNHHAHLLMTTRRLEPEGFTAKTRELDQRKSAEVPHWRERWAALTNEALERAGRSERIDHRSLAAQGIEREPTTHLGPTATAVERRTGEPSRRREDFQTHETGREFAKGATVVNLAEYREAIARQREESAPIIEQAHEAQQQRTPEPVRQDRAQIARAERAAELQERERQIISDTPAGQAPEARERTERGVEIGRATRAHGVGQRIEAQQRRLESQREQHEREAPSKALRIVGRYSAARDTWNAEGAALDRRSADLGRRSMIALDAERAAPGWARARVAEKLPALDRLATETLRQRADKRVAEYRSKIEAQQARRQSQGQARSKAAVQKPQPEKDKGERTQDEKRQAILEAYKEKLARDRESDRDRGR